MEITNDVLPWDSEDVAVFKTFLNSRTGQRLIPKLAESCPTLLRKGDTNEIMIRSGEVGGWQDTLKNLLSLSFPQPEPSKAEEGYPDLEDDKAHNDGQKLT